MEKVLGIGGLFFRSRDPQSLAAWYATHLGVSPVPANYDDPPWEQQPGPTAFAPFPGNTRYFGDPASPQPLQWMVNFRVANLEAFLSQLRATNIPIETGRFGANMQVTLTNDGPATFILDSRALSKNFSST